MRSNNRYLFICIALCAVSFIECTKKQLAAQGTQSISTPPVNDSTYTMYVYDAGDIGISSYRIPAIIKTKDGTLLAFIEGRVNSSADFGYVKILVKQSKDNGHTWGPSSVAAQNGTSQADNATPVVDYTDPNYPNGRIFLFYCTGNNTQANVMQLNGVREIFYVTSENDGQTWDTPVNITLQVHHPYQPAYNPAYTDPLKWTAYATGPGHALQLTQGPNAGRIVVPFNHGIYVNQTNFAAVFSTDDHGKTFKISADATLQSDENTAAELPGGGVIMNSRDQYTGDFRRIMSFDYTGNLDNTTQWASVHNNTLLDPECEGSMINYTTPTGKSVLLFSNPNSTTSRSMLGIRQSFDGGKTWTSPYIYDSGFGAYSDIVILPNGRIGVLYEDDNYNEIRFNSIPYSAIPVQ